MANVLHVVSYYPPDRMGGVGEVVATLHRGLLAAGHQSRVVTTGGSRADPLVLRVSRSPTGFPLLSARALTLARTADVVHVHHGEALGLLAGLKLLRIETPILLTLHVNVAAMASAMRPYRAGDQSLGAWSAREALHNGLVMPLREMLDRAALAMADEVTFISQSAARDSLGKDAASTARVIYNGLPEASASDSAEVEPCDLLFVGSNGTRKRVESLPLLLAAVRARRPNATLRIVGFTAAQNPRLVSLASSLGVLDAIRFEGQKLSGELAAYYRAAGVLLVPSAYEGLPMAILEAFREGLPCVATTVSGHPEVIADGVNGRLVPLDDIEAMAAAACGILDDPHRRASMATAARMTLQSQFSVARQVQQYLDLYERIHH